MLNITTSIAQMMSENSEIILLATSSIATNLLIYAHFSNRILTEIKSCNSYYNNKIERMSIPSISKELDDHIAFATTVSWKDSGKDTLAIRMNIAKSFMATTCFQDAETIFGRELLEHIVINRINNAFSKDSTTKPTFKKDK